MYYPIVILNGGRTRNNFGVGPMESPPKVVPGITLVSAQWRDYSKLFREQLWCRLNGGLMKDAPKVVPGTTLVSA